MNPESSPRRRRVLRGVFAAAIIVTTAGLMAATTARAPTKGRDVMKLTVTSTAFEDQGEIPMRHTCEGDDISPQLAWSQVPAGTRSLALIVDDPDAPDPKAPKMTFVHWVLYDLPPDLTGLPEGVEDPPKGGRGGISDYKRTRYGGPCPPIGRHRYFFKVYALDTVLNDLGQPKKKELLKAMDGHILAQGELVGTYQKKNP